MLQSKEKQLLTRIAWAYHNENMTQADIAAKFGLTRAKVNKLLQDCLDIGMVQIIINSDEASCAEVECQLERRYGLCKAIVVPTPVKEKHLYTAVGATAGDYISQHLRNGQSLGLGWGKTLRASLDGIRQRSPEETAIVSLFGGLPRSGTTNPYDVAAMFARKLNVAQCHYVAAPMYVTSEDVRKALMSQPMFEKIFRRAVEVDMALIGAGDLSTRSTNVVLGALTSDEWHSLLEAGAVGEVFGYFLDSEGKPIDHPLNNRFIGAELDQLKTIPIKVIASGGLQKVPILRAILKEHYADILVTDEITAHAICDAQDGEGASLA
ncbi:sugar-binding transcriptional regulator [Desulfopila aestuarii]|uniref:DNA-binding transcriptional regulator LsrR, DeoR family n=1 Tax=Desulfopila aestuarii DSM 18488 TaxID=1121416 RepID=A0A1M7Y313_9BACT|nr:sugar-binding transcriptional regulator [Desulfopila aestuarii]SHO46372.1 DNA-binding transcriptional regulator LsrR, DeoR family [Desulfopila aestuarii DSM 18488]